MPPASLPFERFLEVRTANGGTFSSDGRLAFLMNSSGAAQVYLQASPEAEPVRLTFTSETVRSVHWSPDGRRLLFTMDDGGSEHEQLFLLEPDGSGCGPLTTSPETIHGFGCWAADSRRIAYVANRTDSAHFDAYVMDVDTGEERCVLARQAHLQVFDWSADGNRLLIRESLTGASQGLSILDLPTAQERPIPRHEAGARYSGARFAPGGRLLVATDHERDFLTLALLDPSTGDLQPLIEEEWDVEGFDLSDDLTRVAALVNRNGWSDLVCGDLAAGGFHLRTRLELDGVASGCRISPDGSRIALALNGPRSNFNVWEVHTETGERRQWTRAPMNDLVPAELVEPELVRYPGHDGLSVPAWLYWPRGAEDGASPLPVIVHVHGGPESQDRPNFSPVYQHLVHRGYAVLAPNVRGSSGYGRRYCEMDDREKRYDALRDVERAYHWLVESGIGDAKRIGIMGGSYGGFTVLYCLTRQPELWSAGVDIVGIANFETFFRHTGPYRRQLRASEYGDPVRDAALLRDLSPIHSADRIRAPLMVVQGANDPRVPQEESDQMVARLRQRSHPVEYLVFPDEGHGIVKIPNRVKAYTAIGKFLERYLPI